jgi:hypothetical protein
MCSSLYYPILSRFVWIHVRTTTKSPNDAFLRTYPRRYATHICIWTVLLPNVPTSRLFISIAMETRESHSWQAICNILRLEANCHQLAKYTRYRFMLHRYTFGVTVGQDLMSVLITWKSGVYHPLHICRAYVELRRKLSESEWSYLIF